MYFRHSPLDLRQLTFRLPASYVALLKRTSSKGRFSRSEKARRSPSPCSYSISRRSMKNPSSSLSGALCLPLRFSGSICEQGVLGKV